MADSTKEYRVKVQVGDATVEVEGAQAGVVEIVRALTPALQQSTGAGTLVSREVPGPHEEPSVQAPAAQGAHQQVDIRTLFKEKQPSSNREAVAVAAFYLEHLAPVDERQSFIDAESLRNSFRQAKYPLPEAIPQALTHARNAGYLDPAGERGKYRLNPVGYNLVEHTLGSDEGGAKRRAPRRRQTQRRTTKKASTRRAKASGARPKRAGRAPKQTTRRS